MIICFCRTLRSVTEKMLELMDPPTRPVFEVVCLVSFKFRTSFCPIYTAGLKLIEVLYWCVVNWCIVCWRSTRSESPQKFSPPTLHSWFSCLASQFPSSCCQRAFKYTNTTSLFFTLVFKLVTLHRVTRYKVCVWRLLASYETTLYLGRCWWAKDETKFVIYIASVLSRNEFWISFYWDVLCVLSCLT